MLAGLRPRDIRKLSVADLTAHLASLLDVAPPLLRALTRDPRRGARALAARVRLRQQRAARETSRLAALFALEDEQRARGFAVIAGVDEAGVAPLAGPVIAAAAILPPHFRLRGLDDSKRLTPPQREALYAEITRSGAALSIGVGTVEEIDRFNILQATRLAHRRAVAGLGVRPQLLLIDGRYPAEVSVPQLVIVDGDATCGSIAAASIVAKVTRDQMMRQLAQDYPEYGFEQHKGYGTRAHLEAIRRLGATPVHRRSFFPMRGRQEILALVRACSTS